MWATQSPSIVTERVTERATERATEHKHAHHDSQRSEAQTVPLELLEKELIEQWASLAAIFGMDPLLGRIHATLYMEAAPLSICDIAERIEVNVEHVAAHLHQLASMGVVQVHEWQTEPSPRYSAESDVWSWFMVTLRERLRSELMPVVTQLLKLRMLAHQANASHHVAKNRDASQRVARIVKFTEFVEQLGSLATSLVSLGAGPLLSTVRMLGRFAPRG